MKGVIFDLDGTLLDTMLEWETIGENYLKSKGLTPEDNINEILKHMSLEEAAQYFIENYGFTMSVKEIVDDTNKLISSKYENDFELKPNVREYIEKLKSDGVKMCVATATEHNMALACLKRLNIDSYFEFLLTCGEVGYSKSYPNIYLEATKRLGFNIEEVILFEDTLKAIETANKAGFNIIGVSDIASKHHEQKIRDLTNKYILDFKELI